RRDIGTVGRDDEIDLVHIEQFGIDARDERRIGLVVVIDKLDWPTEEPALFVGIFGPDLHRQQPRGAVDGEPAGQRHAEPDRNRLTRRRLGPTRTGTGEQSRDGRGYRRRRCPPFKHTPSPTDGYYRGS